MDQNDKNNKNRRGNRNLLGAVKLVAWALVLTLVFYCTSSYMGSAGKQASNINIKYSDFIAMMEDKQVEDVTVDLSEGLLYIVPKDGYVYTAENGTAYTKSTDQDGKAVYAFTDADGKEHTAALKLFTVKMESNDTLVERMHEAGKTDYDTKYEPQMSPLLLFAINFILPFVFIMLMFSLVMRIMAKKGGMGGMGGIGGVGKANAKVYMEKQTGVTFKDVAGQDEAKESLEEIIDFLHNPQKYTAIGARLPKGALLVGSPGTGKTLLAKAVAGEANVPFFSISGSDFVEMFVGVGASRVRDLFKEAAKVAPCIIFIDEIDTIGKSRDGGRFGGGNDEREQTLNQLLAELDGFDPGKGIIVLGATNRPEVLDKALLRPGRFDRQVVVNLPDVRGREQILQVHARKVKMAPGVSFERIARGTSGFSGAQLANLVNEAALLAARKGLKEITEAELEEARDKVSWGRERRSLAINERGRRITAVHEAGHAICLLKTPHSEPLHRVTIVPRGGALGMTMWLPSDDKMHQLRSEMLDQLVVAMGGRCAEQIVFGDVTSGATGDIKSATNLARRMVCEFGMSEKLGLIEYGEHQGEVYIARDLGTRSRNYSESTAELIDSEVRFLVDSAYERAMAILTENRDKLDILTEALMEFETLEGSQVMDILEYGEMKNPPARVTPPPMPPEVEEQPGKDDSGHTGKKEAEETRADGAEERKMEEELEQAERDPFSCNPVDEFGKDGGEKK